MSREDEDKRFDIIVEGTYNAFTEVNKYSFIAILVDEKKYFELIEIGTELIK